MQHGGYTRALRAPRIQDRENFMPNVASLQHLDSGCPWARCDLEEKQTTPNRQVRRGGADVQSYTKGICRCEYTGSGLLRKLM